MKLTLCIGGSVLVPEDPSAEVFHRVCRVLLKLREKHQVLVVVGGGRVARKYISVAKGHVTEAECHKLGIEVTRLNARLLCLLLGERGELASNFTQAIMASLRGKIPVMGGTTPGQTTDAVAAMLARISRSDWLIYISDVDGVYTSDPKVDPLARKLDRVTAEELVRLAGAKISPGMSAVIDPLAARIISNFRIRTLFLGQHELENLDRIVEGGGHTGTEVVFTGSPFGSEIGIREKSGM